MESKRDVPIACEVDVVVAGGSAAAVEAAAAAARAGAKVFLAAPRPYLGDDLCGTLRLWRPEGVELETDLARRLFADASVPSPAPRPAAAPESARFSYKADRPSAGRHKDTDPPSVLTDGRWTSAITDSVQYDGDVSLLCDLGRQRPLKRLRLIAYRKAGAYGVASVTVEAGPAPDKLAPAGKASEATVRKPGGKWDVTEFALPLKAAARCVRVAVKMADGCERVLLGELAIETADTDAAPARPEPTPAPEPDTLRPVTTPMHVKATLDRALLDAGVRFLFGCYATDLLVDAEGRPAGIVIANRAGRQAVRAKVVVDATDRAVLAEQAGAAFRPWPGAKVTCRRVVIGGRPREAAGLAARTVGRAPGGDRPEIIEYAMDLPIPAATPEAFATAEHALRDATFSPAADEPGERFWLVPADTLKACCDVAVGPARPAEGERLYVLGPRSDLPAERRDHPLKLLALAEQVGSAAAAEAGGVDAPEGVRVAGVEPPPGPADRGEVRERLAGPRPLDRGLADVPAPARGLPVLGAYDVVVVGGGTSGAPAGIAAARGGAKTLVIEFLHELGGVGTAGLISRYHFGRRVGFTAEVDEGVAELGGPHAPKGNRGWDPRHKAEWWRRAVRRAGGQVWYGGLGCGVLADGETVRGVVVATRFGRGVVLAGTVIDATGNGDVADAAGAETMFVGPSHIAVQGTGLPVRRLGAGYTNSDYLLVDDADMLDRWRAFLQVRRPEAWDAGQLIDSRERRRVVGDVVLTILDQIAGRTWPDTIVQSHSNYDSHGYPSHEYFMLADRGRDGRPAGGKPYTPYRCLLPAGVEGMLVVGLGASAHRDAMALIRMQADLQNQGYAAGTAAAMAARARTTPRRIDVDALQKHLAEVGNIPAEVLGHDDNFPLPDRVVAEAVDSLRSGQANHRSVAVVLAHLDAALPLLRKAYAAATGAEKLTYARFLGICGDDTGVETLVAALDAAGGWDEKIPLGRMADFSQLPTPVDSLVYALGYSGDRRALEPILRKARLLDARAALSHHRAVAIALEKLARREAAPVLAEVLRRRGMSGHAGIEPTRAPGRIPPLREIVLARALYRLGDHEGLGERILEAYAKDLRGVLARHARAVLRQRQ